MSVFISFNFDTGKPIVESIAEKLRIQKLDSWWFDRPIPPDQLDPMIDLALANCTRCIVLLTRAMMSNWQTAEIVTIRHVFSSRLPAGMARECFIFARATDLAPKSELLPLFHGSEEIEFVSREAASLDFSFLDASPPSLVPVTSGNGRRPRIVRDPFARPERGQHLIAGDFVQAPGQDTEKYCWIFLRDIINHFYIQQPRPTVTHLRRWAAPNIVLGPEINAILLVAAGSEAHKTIVNLVLSQSFGAIKDKALIDSLEILDCWEFPATK